MERNRRRHSDSVLDAGDARTLLWIAASCLRGFGQAPTISPYILTRRLTLLIMQRGAASLAVLNSVAVRQAYRLASMFCQWSGIATTDDAGRAVYRCVNRMEGKQCNRKAIGHREWQSVCELSKQNAAENKPNPLEGIVHTSEVPCKHLLGTTQEEISASCCSNETMNIEIGSCELYGRCEIYGRGGFTPCCECGKFESRG